MGQYNLKRGQLVYCSSGIPLSKYNGKHPPIVGFNTYSGYGNVMDIIDLKTRESYFEKDITTGWGDKNTNVCIKVNLIASCENKNSAGSFWDIYTSVKLIEPIECIFNPHNIMKINLKEFEIKYNRTLENMNSKLDFIKKHSLTRDEKLEKILE